MRKNEEDQTTKLIRTIGNVLIGGVLSLAICIIILFLCSIGISSGWLNDRMMTQYMTIGCVIGSFFGGIFSVLHVQAKTLFVGISTSCIQFLLILSIGFLMFPEISISEHGVVIAAGCLIGGVLAGFLGRNPKKKRRK